MNAEVLQYYKGDTFNPSLVVTDENGAAVDMSTATFDFAIGTVLDEGDATITGYANGTILTLEILEGIL